MTGQRLSTWQLLCEHSWRPRWKSSKVDKGGSWIHEANCVQLSLSQYRIMSTILLETRICTYCKEQVTPNITLQHEMTNAISSPGNMCWKLILYNIRSPTFPSRACITVLKVTEMSCFYRQRPGGKIAFLPDSLPVKYKIPATHKSPDDVASRNTALAFVGMINRKHSCICHGFTHMNSIPEHSILLTRYTTTKVFFQEHMHQEHCWLWQAQLGDSSFPTAYTFIKAQVSAAG